MITPLSMLIALTNECGSVGPARERFADMEADACS
jgi:hypothetical protein